MSDPDQASGKRPNDEPSNEDVGTDASSSDASGTAASGSDASGSNPELAPVPPEGTSAPADSDRVFGRPVESDQPAGQPGGQQVGGPQGGQQPGSTGVPTGQQAPGQQQAPPTWGTPNTDSPLSEQERKQLRTRGRLALVFGIVAVPTSILLFPLGLAMGLTALVLGVLAYRGARKVGRVAAGAVPGIVLGIVATVLASIAAAVTVVFWAEVSEFTRCQESAITHSAQADCQRRFERQLEERLLGPSARTR